MNWETVLSLVSAGLSFAYAAGALRQRIIDLERRLEKTEDDINKNGAILMEIKERVVAIDEWRKHQK